MKSVLSLVFLLCGSQIALADKVRVEDLMYAGEQGVDAQALQRELASGPLDGMNHPDWVTAGNHPDWLTAANHPDWVTAGNHPDWLTAGNHPNWYINGSVMEDFA